MTQTREARLVRIPFAPGESLAGAWFAPARETRVALLYVHGKGGNFYSGTGATIPEHDAAREFAHLSINMRCHDLGYTRDGVPMPDPHQGQIAVAGGMWERLADGHRDVEAGMRWVRERGYDRIVLVGRSSGGFFVAQACAQAGVRAAGRVLLSPVISNKRHLEQWFPGGLLEQAIRRAQELVEAGEGHQLLATRTWFYAISAESLLERIEEPDDILPRMLEASDVPLLLGCGGREPRVPDWRALFDGLHVPDKRWLVLDGVGHDYGGREEELTYAVLGFARAL